MKVIVPDSICEISSDFASSTDSKSKISDSLILLEISTGDCSVVSGTGSSIGLSLPSFDSPRIFFSLFGKN